MANARCFLFMAEEKPLVSHNCKNTLDLEINTPSTTVLIAFIFATIITDCRILFKEDSVIDYILRFETLFNYYALKYLITLMIKHFIIKVSLG